MEREVCSQIEYREKAAAQNPQEGDPRKTSILLHGCGVKASKPLLAKKNQVSPLP